MNSFIPKPLFYSKLGQQEQYITEKTLNSVGKHSTMYN